MPPYDKPAPDRAEIDPVYYKKLTVWLCHALQKENPDVFEHIGGLCIACMRDCLTIVDKEGEALRPLILWLDQRRTSVVRPDNKLLLLGASLLGAGTLLREASQVGYTNYLMDYEKDLWEKADKFVFLSDTYTGGFWAFSWIARRISRGMFPLTPQDNSGRTGAISNIMCFLWRRRN